MADSTVSNRRRSGRSADAAARVEALERLKALRRSGGRRSESGAGIGFQIKIEEPIYDTVAEEDYARIVAERREAAKGFIVDDDGMGYNDEGQEVDWADGGLPPSSDEDGESDGAVDRSRKKKVVKKDPAAKRPAPTSLTAAAALMGKQKLSAMFTSSAFRKNDRGKGPCLSSESIVDDLIAECAPDEADREERRSRRVGPTAVVPGARSFVVAPVSMINDKRMCVPADNPSAMQPPTTPSTVEISKNFPANDDLGHVKDEPTESKEEKDMMCESEPLSNEHANVGKANILEVKLEPEVKSEKGFAFNAKIQVERDANTPSATAGWKAVCEGDNGSVDCRTGAVEGSEVEEKSEFELDSDGSLNFYLIDAHEESFGANAGTIYLFGKVLRLFLL